MTVGKIRIEGRDWTRHSHFNFLPGVHAVETTDSYNSMQSSFHRRLTVNGNRVSIRNGKSEGATASDFALNGNFATVRFSDHLAKRQSQSVGTTLGVSYRLAELLEYLDL